MEKKNFELFVKDFLTFIGKESKKLIFGETRGINLATLSFTMSPKLLYKKLEGSKYCVSEYASHTEALPDFNGTEEILYNAVLFDSQCTRIRLVDQLPLGKAPTKVYQVILSENPQPLIVFVFSKKGLAIAKFDFRIYEMQKTEEHTADICCTFQNVSDLN